MEPLPAETLDAILQARRDGEGLEAILIRMRLPVNQTLVRMRNHHHDDYRKAKSELSPLGVCSTLRARAKYSDAETVSVMTHGKKVELSRSEILDLPEDELLKRVEEQYQEIDKEVTP